MSGGQRQRLAIARALYSGRPVLVLDEATSALDPATEARVLDNLHRHRADRTLVLVSHRPALAAGADRVHDMSASTTHRPAAPTSTERGA